MIKPIVITLSIIGSLISCDYKNTNNNTLDKGIGQKTSTIDTAKIIDKRSLVIETKEVKKALVIDTFSKFPPEISGCGCYSSNNQNEFKANKFIYANDYGENAFISINGKMTKFKLEKANKLKNNHTISIGISEDKQYTLIIDSIETGQIDETTQDKGILTLKSKDGGEVTKNIVGECGC
jgi:hypothetical protein